MSYERIVISSGHGKYVAGAVGILNEVEEARRVVEQVADQLRDRGVHVRTFHDNESHTQNENLNAIVDYHNAQARDLDISVHFNAYQNTSKPMGTEVLYLTKADLAGDLSDAIAHCGFIDRGPKLRTDLFFLNHTEQPAVLLEICFVDSDADALVYDENFERICTAITDVLIGQEQAGPSPPTEIKGVVGKCSQFGGPHDTGVSPDEGLAFFTSMEQAPHLFLPFQPDGTTGLARRLNPHVHYLAMRWDYDDTPKEMLRQKENIALVRGLKTGVKLKAFPCDWGPHENTGRIADLSPGLLDDLGLETDDEVEVIYPYMEDV